MFGFFLTLSVGLTQPVNPKNGYEIQVQIQPFKNGHYFLAYHFGNKQFLVDSAKLDPNGLAIFKGDKKLQGGIYLIVFPEKNGWIECMLDKEQRFSISADTSNLISSLRFTGSPDNTIFNDYQIKSFETGTKMNEIKKLQTNNPSDPKNALYAEQIKNLSNELEQYRESIKKNHPTLLLTTIFNLLKDPTVPPAKEHPGGKYDSTYAYQYYKNHYWDGISLSDERLIRTPVLQGKFDRYFDQILPADSDSIIMYADMMLDVAESNEEMFKFILSSLAEKYVNPKYMGQDAIFVHLFEKYFLAGRADSWMNEKYKKYIFDRGYSLMSNTIGKKAAELAMVDTLGNKFSLYNVDALYTIICFWDPTCGHCREEVPKLNLFYQQKWKQSGIKIIGVMTDGGRENWLKFITENSLKDWMHLYQTDETKDAILKANKPSYRQLYDAYTTPTIYLLDKNKNILAKKLNSQQLDEFIEVKMNSKPR
jgi:thiol-disulfide isomerase/thioredoxin